MASPALRKAGAIILSILTSQGKPLRDEVPRQVRSLLLTGRKHGASAVVFQAILKTKTNVTYEMKNFQHGSVEIQMP